MSELNFTLPSFYRSSSTEIAESSIKPGAFIFAEDSENAYLDLEGRRIPLSAVRTISDVSDLTEAKNGYIHVSSSGDLYINANGNWYNYAPESRGEATYMYRFEVVDRVDQITFDASQLGVTHTPEMDILAEDGTNLSGSDWFSRRWDGSSYILSCTGGWPVGVYYLKISYNVRYGAAGIYIKDDRSTAASINVRPGEHYVFSKPLNSMTVVLATEFGAPASITLKTAESFTFSAPGAKYREALPEFQENSEYYIEVHNGILRVDRVITE